MRNVAVGVIGTGGMGERHAHNLAGHVAGARVVALMDVDKDRAERIARDAGEGDSIEVFDDADALIASDAVDAVVIASPDVTHAQLAKACVDAAKPVLCEKPLATSAPEALGVVEYERAAGRRLIQLGFMREYDPAHQRVMALLSDGDCAEPVYFYGVHINKGDGRARSTEDVVRNSAVHDIHSARFMMPGDIARVNAAVVPDSTPGSCRFVTVSLEYDDGNLGFIECDAQAGYGYEVDVQIRCRHGAVKTHATDDAKWLRGGKLHSAIHLDWLTRFDTAYVNEARDWIDSIQNDSPRGPSAWDGYRSLLIADHCIASAKERQPMDVSAEPVPGIYR